MKKLITCALALSVVLGGGAVVQNSSFDELSITASAETSGDFDYTVLDDGTVEINRYNGTDKKVVVPEQIDGKTVTIIGENAFTRCHELKSVTVPDSVTEFGRNAFAECEKLESVNMPASLTTIGNSAFLECGSLENVVFPSTLKTIDDSAFRLCISLTKLDFPDGLESIGYEAFYQILSLERVSIPASVTDFGDCIFYYCEGLTSVEFRDGLEAINGKELFGGCYDLKSIVLPDSLKSIEKDAILNEQNLTIYCNSGTYAEQYALENGISHALPSERVVETESKENKFPTTIVIAAATAVLVVILLIVIAVTKKKKTNKE